MFTRYYHGPAKPGRDPRPEFKPSRFGEGPPLSFRKRVMPVRLYCCGNMPFAVSNPVLLPQSIAADSECTIQMLSVILVQPERTFV